MPNWNISVDFQFWASCDSPAHIRGAGELADAQVADAAGRARVDESRAVRQPARGGRVFAGVHHAREVGTNRVVAPYLACRRG